MKGLRCIYNGYDKKNNKNNVKFTLDLLYIEILKGKNVWW